MTSIRTFVALDHLPEELVPAVRDAIAAWRADRPHLTDVEVVRYVAPAPTDLGMNPDRADTWTRGLYLHGCTITAADVTAIREALAPYGEARVSEYQDAPASPPAPPASVPVRVAALGLRVMGAKAPDARLLARLEADLAHVPAGVLDQVAAALAAVPDAHVLDQLTTEDAANVAAALAARPDVAGVLAPGSRMPRVSAHRFAAAAYAVGAALLHVEGVLKRRSARA